MKCNFCLVFIVLFCASCHVKKNITAHYNAKLVQHQDERITKETEFKLFFDVEKKRLLSDKKTSLIAYQEFVAKYPNNATARYNLAKLLFDNNNQTNALVNAKKASYIDPKNETFRSFYATMLLYNDQLELANLQFDSLLIEKPNDEEYLFKKAMIYLQNDDMEKAVECFDKLEKIVGLDEELMLQKKNILFRNGKINEAELEVKKLIKAFPESPKYTLMLIDMKLQNKQVNSADSLYHQIEKNYPNDAMAQIALLQYYFKSKKIEKQNDALNRILRNQNIDEKNKLSILLPILKSIDKDSIKQKKTFLNNVKLVVAEMPTNIEAQSLYANLLYYAGETNLSHQAYEKVLQLDSSKIESWTQLLSVRFEMKAYESLIDLGKKGTLHFPKNGIMYFYQGMAEMQVQKTNEATFSLEKAKKNTQYNAEIQTQIHASLGEAYNQLKQFEKSDSNFKKALQFSPDDAYILNNYAYYLSLRKVRLEEAEKMSKYSLILLPNSKSFLDTYGWILFQQGKYADAKLYIEKAIVFGGETDGALFEHLGDIYFKLNETSKAIEAWKKANTLGEINEELLKKIKYERLPE
jgi:tetratricopeptide (TPR) repeat protein